MATNDYEDKENKGLTFHVLATLKIIMNFYMLILPFPKIFVGNLSSYELIQ